MISSRGVQPTNVILLLSILIEQKNVDSLIVQGPSNTTAMVNESTYFNCSTSIRPISEQSIIWFHFPLDGGGQRNYVYDDGRIMTNYRNRFDIDKDLSSGKFNLLILRLEPQDAGKYECRDDVHADLGASAELTVLESTLACESDLNTGGVVRPNQCDKVIAPDELQLSCSVTYNGRNTPQMVWRKSGDSLISSKTNCVTKDNRVACNTTLAGNLQLNRSVYICDLTTQKYNCSLEIKNISYVFGGNTTVKIAIDEEVKCSANSSQSCSYKWKWFSESDSLTVSTDQTLKPTRVGSHRCEATCPIGNTSCVVDVMFAEVYSTQSSEATTGQIYLWILLPLLLVLILITTVMVVRYLRSKRHPPPPNKSDEAIERHRTFLEDNIDPDFGLLDKLLAKGTLSSREILEVKDKSPYFKRNFQLLNYILEKHQGDRLIEALRDKEQRHIVNYLNRNGEYNPEYGEEWPLTAKEISILDTNQESLIELLDLSDLLGLLRSTKVINRRQMNFISSKPNSDDQTEALIGILRRRSLRDYQQTISCLRQSNQSQVADLLESGGVVARVHAHLDGLLEYVKQTEDAVVARFKSLQSKSVAEISRLFKFKVIAAKKGESIVLYIWCETVEELQDLQNNDQLKDSAEQLFHQLLTPSKKITVKDITLDDEEFERMKKYFTEPDKTEEKQKQEPDETEEKQKQEPDKTEEKQKKEPDKTEEKQKKEPDKTEEKQKKEPDKTEEKQKQEPDKTEEKQKQEPDETEEKQKQEPDETEKKQKQEPDKTEEKQKQEPDKTEEKQKQEPDETKKEQKQEPDEAEEKQKQETEICYEEDPVLVKTIRTKAAEEFETGISGLAIADNVLFITTFHSNVIEVYDLKSLALSDRWPLNAAENPWDLGYCSRNKYLYVMDADLKYILKVDLNGKLFIMFSAGKGYGCISVTNDCNVLMADYEGNKITEYTSEGQIVLEIDLSASSSGGFVHPGHAIKLTDSRYLMSHGEGKDPLHRVCVVDRSGNIQMFFVVQRGSPFDRLFAPIYLAIDSNGSIFVIDRDKSRVLLLSSGLELIREIISTKKGIHNPERIALDQANGRLLLVHYDEDLADCRVSIFKIL